MSDPELERLRARRLAEMRRSAAARAAAPPEPARPRDELAAALGHRGLEVLEAAEAQFPSVMPAVVGQLAALARSGELPAPVDGGQLLAVLRAAGLRVRLDTRIRVEQDGRAVALSDRLRGAAGGAGAGA